MKVNDENLWQNYVKTGIIRAISLEGIFAHQLVKQSMMSKDDIEAHLLLSQIREIIEAEVNPSVASTYPGESAEGKKKYKSPALLVEGDMCPEATQNIKTNIENRQNAIDTANYGPLNPNEPNEDYWKAKADMFKGDVETAKKSLCGNCAFFIQTKQMLDCIAGGIGGDVKDEWDTIKAGTLGFCSAFDYKCSSERTCDIWLVGGPITD
jgi:hypothetical protein